MKQYAGDAFGYVTKTRAEGVNRLKVGVPCSRRRRLELQKVGQESPQHAAVERPNPWMFAWERTTFIQVLKLRVFGVVDTGTAEEWRVLFGHGSFPTLWIREAAALVWNSDRFVP